MFSFDLSPMNIFLGVAVVALFILFITVLMKLNPSTETKERAIETEIKVERPKPLQTSPIVPRTPPPAKIEIPRVTEKPLVAVSPTIGGSSTQTEPKPSVPTRIESREIPTPKPEKTGAPPKTDFAPSRRDCLHQFGYLRTLPKNAPIPDECFGCSKIVECLVNAKTRER